MNPVAAQSPAPVNVESLLLELADVVNTTLDLDTLLRRTAEQIRRIIDYEIFSILLLNEKTQELRIRFSIGHPPEMAERMRIKVGQGVTGQSVLRREAVLVNDVSKETNYIDEVSGVCSELAVPLIVKNTVIGVIDIEARQPGHFTEEHRRLLTLVASRIAAGIENARLYTRVSRQAQTLGLLNEISRELTSILNLDELLKHIAELLTRVIDYQMFSILLLDPTNKKLEHRFSVRFKESVQIKNVIELGVGLVGYAAAEKKSVLVPDVKKDARYIEVNPETRSELVVPLIYKDSVIGVLDLEHTKRGFFTDDHRRTIGTLAAQVAIAIENARLYERIAKEEQRLERDLATARELQFRLLPPSCPALNAADISARYVPAHAIGGDMYDFMSYSSSRTAIAVGDVSGKGAPAALYAALVSGILRSSALSEPSAAEMLQLVNTSLIDRPIAAQFLAMIYAIWHDEENSLQIANSGLPRPIFCHEGRVETVQATGLPLGFFPDAEHEEFWINFAPGDVCVLFSDGISDARNQSGDSFGRRRVEEAVAKHCNLPAEGIMEAIYEEVSDFACGVTPFDDQTIVVLKAKDLRPLKTKAPAKSPKNA